MKRIMIMAFMVLVSVTIVSAFDCSTLPGEWVNVPGNSVYNTSDFCVMKYEAKSVGSVATSQAAGNPWINLNQNQARVRCENLNNGTGNYNLITNAEWMTIARNIESQQNNWANGIIGSSYNDGGGLFVGNVGNIDGTFRSHSCNQGGTLSGTVDGNNCLISEGIHDGRNKRTLFLSNGEEIWDFSGNAWEWLNETISMHDWVLGGSGGNWDIQTNETFRLNAGPSNSSWGITHGMGHVIYSSDSARALLRGGTYNTYGGAGAFALALHISPTYTSVSIGFRCSYVPPITPPVFYNFQSHPETTDFSSVADITNVDNPVLATTNAKIQWNAAGMNFNGADLDSAVSFAPNHVSVRSDLLQVLNTTATIEFKNVNYAGLEAFNVLKNGELCVAPECVKILASPATVEVSGFSNYTTQDAGTPGEIPEFNVFTLIIGLVVIAIAITVIRKR